MTMTEPRDLSRKELALLRLLLSVNTFPGAHELASQVEGTKVAGGLRTLLNLDAPRSALMAKRQDGPIPVRAFVQSPGGETVGEILVWVKDGYLSGLEFAWFTDDAPTEMPEIDRIRVE